MRAFEVFYDVSGESGKRAIVLAEAPIMVEYELKLKDPEFETDSRWCCIVRETEVPLGSVKLTDLSVADLLKILGK